MEKHNEESSYSATAYIHALEEERKKIQVFQKELPLCLQLITHEIDCAQQRMNNGGDTKKSSAKPVLEEFLPLRPSTAEKKEDTKEGKTVDKPDWLRSVQLWNQEPETVQTKYDCSSKPVDDKKNDKEKEDSRPLTSTFVAALTSSGTSTSSGDHSEEKKSEKQVQTQRKARRCWSPELHRQFLQALEQLGGIQVGTPKQIRELMDVDGLTNDEVKSHLQKYRLHTKRPNAVSQNCNDISPANPQIVVVGGIWVPSASVAQTKGVCAPIALLPSEMRFQQKQV